MSYRDMVRRATGHDPYPWQVAVAETGLPEVISAETGTGKTEGVVLPWLWRRRLHPDPAVRAGTPHWLVLVLPLRALTEQVEGLVRGWIRKLGFDGDHGVAVHVAMGGRGDVRGRDWQRSPEGDAVVVGTVDMLLSRALNRGYVMSRFDWPIDFGLLHNGVHWVFDEVQLLGPALATSRQLEALRHRLGTAVASGSTWMSATLDVEQLVTVDNPKVDPPLSLSVDDRAGGLQRRLAATRRVEQVATGDNKAPHRRLAAALVAAHQPGTLTAAVLNTVRAARALHEAVAKEASCEVVLLHSRFRPVDRRVAMDRVLAELGDAGRIVISTQVIEAGVDLSAATMLIEAAPWPSVVQRAGRCNRDGLADGRLLWVGPLSPGPYVDTDVASAAEALRSLEGLQVTATELAVLDVAVTRPVPPVLRESDLLGLFDTTPDLSGNDIDIAPFVRTIERDVDVHVAWRDLGGQPPSLESGDLVVDELCPVPVGEASELDKRGSALWHLDRVHGGWDRVRRREIRPGMTLLTDTHAGGYRPDTGWDLGSRTPVEPVPQPTVGDRSPETFDNDRPTYTGVWVGLSRHLGDVERAVGALVEGLAPDGVAPEQREAAVVAGRLHDIGKAHEVFQDTLRRSAAPALADAVARGAPWAKSDRVRRALHRRRNFSHELAAALMLLGDGGAVLDGLEAKGLVIYLVAAHHGKIRMGIRSVDGGDVAPAVDEEPAVRGICEGDVVGPVAAPTMNVPAATLSLAPVQLGCGPDGSPSWSERSLRLLDQLGPFRLAWLEAVVRLADWRASGDEAQEASEL